MAKATQKEIRNHYKSRNCEVRIDRYGRVTYRQEGESVWLDGRWADEYSIDAVHGVVFS